MDIKQCVNQDKVAEEGSSERDSFLPKESRHLTQLLGAKESFGCFYTRLNAWTPA